MTPILQYLWLTLQHKWFVFQAGLRTRAPLWSLVIHDWSKFTPAEAPHYGRQFFGDKGDPLGFSYAWLNHQRKNKHHWEYWIMTTGHTRGGYPDGAALPMPEKYVREMVADWMGASRAYSGKWPETFDDWTWFHDNWTRIALRMHPETICLVEHVLRQAFRYANLHSCFACEDDGLLRWPDTGGSKCYELDCPVCARVRRIKTTDNTVKGDPLPCL